MKDLKEQELLEAYIEADRKCAEADRDRADADLKLWEYRVGKAKERRKGPIQF